MNKWLNLFTLDQFTYLMSDWQRSLQNCNYISKVFTQKKQNKKKTRRHYRIRIQNQAVQSVTEVNRVTSVNQGRFSYT